MNTRQAAILAAIMSEYIRTGEPVGSAWLVSEVEFDVSPATMRNEMSVLDEAGYLEQPHTSAGRVPTEAAFRYYLEHFLEVAVTPVRIQRVVLSVFKTSESVNTTLRDLARRLSAASQEATLVGSADGEVYVSGLAHLLRQPEFQEYEPRLEAAAALEACEDVAQRLYAEVDDEIAVFLGSQNPFGREYGAVVTKLPVGSTQAVLGIVGPMRMDYPAQIGLLQSLHRILAHREAEVRVS